MKTLYHLALDHNDQPKECAFVDGNGFKYVIPYDTPTDIQSDYMADKIVEHCHYYGIVEVHSTRDRSGVHFDMEDARERANESLLISEKACINDYVRNQLEDRVRQNFPPLPPTGRSLECCTKHKYNLLKAGIRCVGWEPPYSMDDPGLGQTVAANEASVQQQIAQIQAQLLQQNQLILQLLTGKKEGAILRNAGTIRKQSTSEAALAVADDEE